MEQLKDQGLNLVFCWVPGHVGLKGNKKVDSAAKRTLREDVIECPIPAFDFSADSVVLSYILSRLYYFIMIK